ncbi:MAG: DNA-3-methyladenine glycosylase [Thermomicrobiales bacterium]
MLAPHDRQWFERHPFVVAFDLLGHVLSVDRDGDMTSGRIVEVEAYAGPDDLASHAGTLRAGKSALNGESGVLYMYRSYGIHTMLNIVAHEPAEAGAVLIRAIEPVDGHDIMQARRGSSRVDMLTSGPGNVCQAMGFRLSDNGVDLQKSSWIDLKPGPPPSRIWAGPRIGISRSVARPWRLFDADCPFVSSHRRGNPVESIPELIAANE